MMASEDLVNILVHTDVTRYLEFKQIAGSYVYREGKIAKLPANETEALASSLMSFFEKRRARDFFKFVQEFEEGNPKFKPITFQTPTIEIFKKFGLEPGTQDFIGHAMALFLDDRLFRYFFLLFSSPLILILVLLFSFFLFPFSFFLFPFSFFLFPFSFFLFPSISY